MKEFRDRVAVVTGAASGIGRALAQRFAEEGMKVVLADVEAGPLEAVQDELKARGASVLGVPTDVSKLDDVRSLARKTLDAFGAVHVLCNNAGVAGTAALSWERSVEDWNWVFGVNLWGVIHGIQPFVPILLRQGSEGHIVNTASMAGVTSGPGTADYGITKHAVVTLSESLHHELALTGAKPKVSVLCPGWVNTQILESERNRPDELRGDSPTVLNIPGAEPLLDRVRELLSTGMKPERVADRVLEAIREEKFYVMTHPEFVVPVRTRMENILEGRNPIFSPLL